MYAIINPENGQFVYAYGKQLDKPRTWARRGKAEKYLKTINGGGHLAVVEVRLEVVS